MEIGGFRNLEIDMKNIEYEYKYLTKISVYEVASKIEELSELGWEPVSINLGSSSDSNRDILLKREKRCRPTLKYKVDALILKDKKNFNIECIVESDSKLEALSLFEKSILNNDSECIVSSKVNEILD